MYRLILNERNHCDKIYNWMERGEGKWMDKLNIHGSIRVKACIALSDASYTLPQANSSQNGHCISQLTENVMHSNLGNLPETLPRT